jgi:hypothetical protein
MQTFKEDFGAKTPHIFVSAINVFETYSLSDFNDADWEQRNIPPHGKYKRIVYRYL